MGAVASVSRTDLTTEPSTSTPEQPPTQMVGERGMEMEEGVGTHKK